MTSDLFKDSMEDGINAAQDTLKDAIEDQNTTSDDTTKNINVTKELSKMLFMKKLFSLQKL